MAERKVTLSKSQDWDTWISYVRMLATTSQTWTLIDPSLSEKPSYLAEPIEPVMPVQVTNETYTQYKMLSLKHKQNQIKFEKQQFAFKKIIKYIQITISTENVTLIQKIEAHSYDLFLTLKRRLASINSTRKLIIEQQYRKLCEESRNQNVDKWLNEWIRCFDLAKEYRVAEIIDEKRFVRDFLFAVDDIDSTFSESKMSFLNKIFMNINTVIEDFKNRMRLKKTKKSSSASHSAFAIYDSKESNKDSNDDSKKNCSKKNKKIFFRRKNIESVECICVKKHWYSHCFNLNQKKRFLEWKADFKIQQKVQDVMKKKDFKAKVKRSLKRNNDIKKKKNSENENGNNSSDSSNVEENMNYAFTIVDDSIFSSKTSSKSNSFRSSWILDYAATIYVCNDIMTYRFIKNRDGDKRIVTAENCKWTIQSYNHIVIKRQKKFEIKEMILLNVCYIFEFMTNLISRHILTEKDVHFMSETKRLYRNKKTIVYAIKKNDHIYIEDNDDENQNFESENENFD